jgi:hypothetical protein
VRTSSFEKREKKKKSHLTNQTEICNAQYKEDRQNFRDT